ncbi:hypothetical protein [Yoonia maritima]|uniref:hypothetical protein n=1 Tax=Yoonia maritima TaxID=1435347 RepID=UPI00373580AB
MRQIESLYQLEKFGRTRLSQHFFMRDFLHSEVSDFYRVGNIPDNPDLAIKSGRHLCTELLDPLVNTFGPIHVRSAYRSARVNAEGNTRGHNCANNEANFGVHVWDHKDKAGNIGATACIVVPWFSDQYDKGRDWRDLAFWLDDHLEHSGVCFYPKLAAFNLSWSEAPKPRIFSYIAPRGTLRHFEYPEKFETCSANKDVIIAQPSQKSRYSDFPKFCGICFPSAPKDW